MTELSSPSSLRSGARAAAALGLLVAAALPARAADRVVVRPSFSVAHEYASNPLAEEEGTTPSDSITYLNPGLGLIREGTRGHVNFQAGGRARLYSDFDDFSAFNPFARFDFERDLTPRLELFADGSWSSQRALDPLEEGGELLQSGRPELDKYAVTAGLRYRLDPRSTATFELGSGESDYDPGELEVRVRDNDWSQLHFTYTRSLTPRDLAGVTVTHRWSEFGVLDATLDRTLFAIDVQRQGRTELDEQVTAATAFWNRVWSPAWETRVTAGSRALESDGNGFSHFRALIPPLGDLSREDRSVSFVGGVVASRAGQRSELALGWSAETRPSTGQTGSLDVQTLSLSYRLSLTSRLELEIGGALSRLESATDSFSVVEIPPDDLFTDTNEFLLGLVGCQVGGGVIGVVPVPFRQLVACARPGSSEIDTELVVARIGLRWRVRENAALFARYRVRDQSVSGLLGSDYIDHRFQIGLQWSFDLDVP